MATEVIEKDFVTIKVSKKIGTTGINRVKAFVKSLEANNGKQSKLNQKIIDKLSREINKAAWEKLKKKRGFTFK
jgi:hypothetical protein